MLAVAVELGEEEDTVPEAVLELAADAMVVLLIAPEEETMVEDAAGEDAAEVDAAVDEFSIDEALMDETPVEEIPEEEMLVDEAAIEETSEPDMAVDEALFESVGTALLPEEVVVPLIIMEEDIEPEEVPAAEVVEPTEERVDEVVEVTEERVDEVADPSVDCVAELITELVELEKANEEVELDTTEEVTLRRLLDEAVLLADAAEDPGVVELLARDSTMAKSVPGAATLLFLSTLL